MRSPVSTVGAGHRTSRKAAALGLAAAGALLAGCASATPTTQASATASFAPVAQNAAGEITVWADSTRLPAVQAYQKANPGVKMNIVTYDVSADGATYLQT